MSEARGGEEPKVTPAFLAQVYAAGLWVWKGEKGELRFGDAEFVVLGDSVGMDRLE